MSTKLILLKVFCQEKGAPLSNLSQIIAKESQSALGQAFTSNTYRHAMHSHGRTSVGTSSLANALQHSERIAESTYVHNTEFNTAFVDYFDFVLDRNQVRF